MHSWGTWFEEINIVKFDNKLYSFSILQTLIIFTFLSLLETYTCRVLLTTTQERNVKSTLSPDAATSLSPVSLSISYEALHYPAPTQEELQYRDAFVPVVINIGRRIPFVNPVGNSATNSWGQKSLEDGMVETLSPRKSLIVRSDPNAIKTELKKHYKN